MIPAGSLHKVSCILCLIHFSYTPPLQSSQRTSASTMTQIFAENAEDIAWKGKDTQKHQRELSWLTTTSDRELILSSVWCFFRSAAAHTASLRAHSNNRVQQHKNNKLGMCWNIAEFLEGNYSGYTYQDLSWSVIRNANVNRAKWRLHFLIVRRSADVPLQVTIETLLWCQCGLHAFLLQTGNLNCRFYTYNLCNHFQYCEIFM